MKPLDGWASVTEAIERHGIDLSRARICQLARRGEIDARRVGKTWLVSVQSLRAHQEKMEALGDDRFNPWRDGLEPGRGRQRESE